MPNLSVHTIKTMGEFAEGELPTLEEETSTLNRSWQWKTTTKLHKGEESWARHVKTATVVARACRRI